MLHDVSNFAEHLFWVRLSDQNFVFCSHHLISLLCRDRGGEYCLEFRFVT